VSQVPFPLPISPETVSGVELWIHFWSNWLAFAEELWSNDPIHGPNLGNAPELSRVVPSCPELLQYAELLQRTCTLKYIVLQYALQAPSIEEAKFQLQEEQELLQFGTYGVVRCFVFWVSIWVFPISEKLLSWFDMIWGSTLGIGVCSPDIPLAWVNLHPTPPSWLGEWRHFLNGWFAKSRHWIDD